VLVLDTSITMGWCFADEASAYSDHVLRQVRLHGGVAPSIWPFEVANAVLTGERRGRLTQTQIARFVRTVESLSLEIDRLSGPMGALGPVRLLARQLQLSAYDASFIELARRRGLPLATLDGRMRTAATALGVPLVAAPTDGVGGQARPSP